jgi:hypothetical protein
MDKRKIEALAEAIADTSGYRNPDHPAHAARNPGALKAYSPTHVRNEQGQRVFRSMLDGWQALIFDIEVKLAGRSRAHLTAHNCLADFAEAFGQPATAAQAWAKYLRRSLTVEGITHKTTLDFFMENK